MILARRARREGSFLGTRPDLHRRDNGAFARCHEVIEALPGPAALERLERFLAATPDRYAVELHDA